MSVGSSVDESMRLRGSSDEFDSTEAPFLPVTAEGGHARAESRDGSMVVAISHTQEHSHSEEKESFEEEFKIVPPLRQESVERLSKLLTSSQPKSSKIDYGQEASLPKITRQVSATTLMEMVKKEKETRDKSQLEERAADDAECVRSPGYRPLTGTSSHSRLATPNMDVPQTSEDIKPCIPTATMSMSDSPSPQKQPVPENEQRMTDSPVSALHSAMPSRGAAADFDSPNALDDFKSILLPIEQDGDDNSNMGDSLVDSPAPKSEGQKNKIRPNPVGQLDIGVELVLVDTIKVRGKLGHYTVNRVQQFPEEFSGNSPGKDAAPGLRDKNKLMGNGGSPAREGYSSGAQDNVDNASVTYSARSIVSMPNVLKEKDSTSSQSIFKPFKGHHLTANNSFTSFDLMNQQETQLDLLGPGGSVVGGDDSVADSLAKGGKQVVHMIAREIQGQSVNIKTPVPRLTHSHSELSVDESNTPSQVIMPFNGLPRSSGDGDSVQLSDRSSIHSVSVNTDDGKDPLKRLTLQESMSSMNKLYEASKRDALAMLYLNESEKSLRDDDSMSSAGGNTDLVPYRVHNRIMGWKLTSPSRRKQLLDILDGQEDIDKDREIPSVTLARQAEAWGSAVQRMHRARDRTPQGYFKKMMRERAVARGQAPRGARRPGSVQSHLIAETDKAGLHRAIAAGLVELEQEAFLEQVREKSREQSRQRTASKQTTNQSHESKVGDSLGRRRAEIGDAGLFEGRIEGPISPW